MQYVLAFFLLCVLAIPFGVQSQFEAWAGNAPAAITSNYGAVFNLVKDGRAFCTSFAVEGPRKERVMMTAGHCVDGLRDDTALYALDFKSGVRYQVKVFRAKYKWPQADYAILHYVGAAPSQAIRTSDALPALGDEVWTIAAPLGLTPLISQGLFAGYVHCADDPTCEVAGMLGVISNVGASGASGSPVMDAEGRVWGILVGGRRDLSGVGFVTPIGRELN